MAPANSIALSTRAPIGHLAILGSQGCTNQGCKLLVPTETIRSEFLFEILEIARHELQAQGHGTTFLELSRQKLGNFRLAIPPVHEQSDMVRFLEHAHRGIRRYIHAKQKLIALLEEQKQAIIRAAVTGEMDVGRGRPYANYRDSRMEWLREVPKHWQTRKLGHVARVFNGATPSRMQSAYWENGTIPWLNSSKVNDGLVVEPAELVTDRAVEECAIALVRRGAVILGLVGQGKTRGMAALLGISTTISQNVAAIVPSRSVDGAFVYRLLTAMYGHIREKGRGGNQEALNCELVGRLRIPMPPLVEQIAIVRYLDRVLSKLDKNTENISNETALMKELHSRLVADVVTGKVDVRKGMGRRTESNAGEHEKMLLDSPTDDATADLGNIHGTIKAAKA